MSDLAEALRDSDDVKKQRNEIVKENKELRERLEALEKEVRIKSLQRSPGHCHSHDSAIDSDLQEWETENIDIDMVRTSVKEKKRQQLDSILSFSSLRMVWAPLRISVSISPEAAMTFSIRLGKSQFTYPPLTKEVSWTGN